MSSIQILAACMAILTFMMIVQWVLITWLFLRIDKLSAHTKDMCNDIIDSIETLDIDLGEEIDKVREGRCR